MTNELLSSRHWNLRGNRYGFSFAMPDSLDLATDAGRRAWCRRLLGPMDEAKFEALARELFAWQFARVAAFRRLCVAYGVEPKNLRSWREIPAVPQALFKREMLYAAGLPKPAAVYETSGTTTGLPGRQHLLSTDIYRAVSVQGAQQIGLLAQVEFLHFLVPSPTEAPHSSLSAMFGFWQEEHGKKNGKFWVAKNSIDFASLRGTLAGQIKRGEPAGIAGTAFSFVHLLDAWVHLPPLKLPRGSWLLETGGFKGRSREVSKRELYAQLARTFSLRDVDIYNEYGMSELSSQAYTHGTRGAHHLPPWARVLVVDPATRREVRVGQRGLVRWVDLANVDSVMALQTLDVAERTALGFNLIGRLPRTEPRGCSLSAEDLAASSSN
jgi:Acyl-protein synthetase, LuxE